LLGRFDVGGLGVFVGYSRHFAQPINMLSQQTSTLFAALAGAERVFNILDMDPEEPDKEDALDMPDMRGDVELKNIVVRGKIIVNGAGNVTLDGVTASALEANSRYGTEFLVTGKTAVVNLIPYGAAIINESELEDGYYGIKRITVQDSDDLKMVILKSGTVEQTVTKTESSKTKK